MCAAPLRRGAGASTLDGVISWVAATFLSAAFLGCYDLCTKHAVRGNAVLPVLFLANFCSTVVWSVILAIPHLVPAALPAALTVTAISPAQHGLLLLKSAIVASSWTCTYFAVKHLPVSLASPVRSTGPVWTLLGAVLILGERPSWLESLGIVITLGSFLGLSVVGRAEGIDFHRNRWIGYLVAGTLLGAVSGLYDKFLLGRMGFTAATVQCWYLIYLAVLFLPLALGWKFRLWARNEFHWRWSIVFVSLSLLVSDFLYFGALRQPGALIALVASLRASSVLVAFAGGLLIFREQQGLRKLPAVLGVLIGLALTLLG